MPLLFPEELSVGIADVDDQHRGFYLELNRLHDAMKRYDLDQVLRTADYLVQYASDHFATEERLMIEAGYPGFPEHLARHAEFKQDLGRWRARLGEHGPTAGLVVELSGWLTQWMRDHIRSVDARMAKYLRGRPGAG
jgi:hemerythrin